MRLTTPSDFRFVPAATSHGFFLLAPNRWDRASQSLHTVVGIEDRAWTVVVAEHPAGGLRVCVPGARPGAGDQRAIGRAVRRILRLEKNLRPFHRLCRDHASHRGAARMRFGRLIRSATLFEDIVKVMCTCNITWKQTVGIVAALVRHYGAAAGNDASAHAFPQPAALAGAKLADLKAECRLGYRAPWVQELSRSVADGALDLESLERAALPSEELSARLRRIKGIGEYAAGNLLALLGHYDHLAIDTEAVRHFRRHYPRRKPTPAAIRRHYDAYQPYAFLAYWYELWRDYVDAHGEPTSWSPAQGTEITREPQAKG
jgi:3-methyladenine DNA glycosylase/8-oxoguanine DNA glycosylase